MGFKGVDDLLISSSMSATLGRRASDGRLRYNFHIIKLYYLNFIN